LGRRARGDFKIILIVDIGRVYIMPV
jgi:hypothetical protein